jgi:hypothetical protein
MKKELVKIGRKIIGFTWQDQKGQYWFAFGKPSQSEYIAFACDSIEQGRNKILEYAAPSLALA